MAIAVAFRFREREYYQELNTGDELLMGCHKKDTVQIPNSKEHLLIMKNVGDEVKAAAAEPLRLPSSLLSCNELMVLSRSVEATLYLSRVIPRSAKAVNLPYNGSIRVGRHPDNDIVVSYPIISGHHFQLQLEAGQVHVQRSKQYKRSVSERKKNLKGDHEVGRCAFDLYVPLYPAKWNAVF